MIVFVLSMDHQHRAHNLKLEPRHPNCLGPRKLPNRTLISGMATLSSGDLYAIFGVMDGFMPLQGRAGKGKGSVALEYCVLPVL